MEIKTAKPFIKWPGGKQKIISHLLSLVPDTYGKYIDPFFGGGAFFYALNPSRSVLSDINEELINLYDTVKSSPRSLINSVSKHKNDIESFYRIRDKDEKSLGSLQRASRLLFLNKTCYNGLYRVNRKGEFNVPYAGYKNRKIYDSENIYACAKVLESSEIYCLDYREVLNSFAKKNDLIFLDPPYFPISKNNSFVRYNKNPFTEENHIELSEIVRDLDRKGCHVIIANSDHPSVVKMYAGMNIEKIRTQRSVSCNGSMRSGVDLIITNINIERKVREKYHA